MANVNEGAHAIGEAALGPHVTHVQNSNDGAHAIGEAALQKQIKELRTTQGQMRNCLKQVQMDYHACTNEIAALKGAVEFYRHKFFQVDEVNRELGTHIQELTAEYHRLRATKRPAEEDPKHESWQEEGEVGPVEPPTP